jgi:hypothetical protein
MATTAKNFRIKQGLIVEGTTATINNNNILVEVGGVTYINGLIANLITNATKSYITITKDGSNNLTITAEKGISSSTTSDLTEGTNLYFTTTRARAAISASSGISYDSSTGNLTVNRTTTDTWYDAAGAASTAETNARNYADSVAQGLNVKTSVVVATTGNITLSGAQTIDGVSVVAGNRVLVKSQTTAANNGIYVANASTWTRAADQATPARGDFVFIDSGTSNGKTGWILGDNTTTWTQFSAAGEYTSGSGITITGNSIAVNRTTTDTWYDAAGAATTAQSNAATYTNTVSGHELDGTSAFTKINVNNAAAAYATNSTIVSAGSATAWIMDATVYSSAKLLVKFKTSTNTQMSELLLTLDSANNIAITEYAEVTTSGELGTITASYSAGNVNVVVTTLQSNTSVTVYATALI